MRAMPCGPRAVPTGGAGVTRLGFTGEADDVRLVQVRKRRFDPNRRTEAERLKLGDMFTSNTLAQFLPVIDDFDRAMMAVPEDQKENGWVSGITMIHNKLHGILERAGVTEVEGVNAPFDPAVHEAVASDPGSSGEVVVEVYQKGYKIGDTLLRAAMVKTGDKVAEPESASADNVNA